MAKLLQRLGKLYMVPNWTEENAVILAEWIIDNYKYEELSLVESVLRNPPKKENKHGEVESNWRLTPDTIHLWMAPALERATITREKAQEQFKLSEKNAGPLDKVDYDAFRARLESGMDKISGKDVEVKTLQDNTRTHWSKEDDYLKFRTERAKKNILSNPPK